MRNSDLLLSQITCKWAPDDLIARCLDALREDRGLSYIDAVVEVALRFTSATSARDVAEAASHLAKDSPIREQLEQEIAADCVEIPPGALLTIVTEPGDHWPRAVDTSLFSDGEWLRSFHVSVGARWVKRVANRLMIERRSPPPLPRGARSRRSTSRKGGPKR